jgi:hypothetical protein
MGTLLDMALAASRRADRAGDQAAPRTSASAAPAAAPPPAAAVPSCAGPGQAAPAFSRGGTASGTPSGAGDARRALRLAELRRLVLDLASSEPRHWTPSDIAEALREGELDLDAALQTWRTLCVRLGVRPPEAPGTVARRERVRAMLAERPGIRYAIVGAETEPRYTGCVVLGLGVRRPDGTVCTCDLLAPRHRYDPFLVLDLIERAGGSQA